MQANSKIVRGVLAAGVLSLAVIQAPLAASVPISVTLDFEEIDNAFSRRVAMPLEYGGFLWSGGSLGAPEIQDYGYYNFLERNNLAKVPASGNAQHLTIGGSMTMTSAGAPFFFHGVFLEGYRRDDVRNASITARFVDIRGFDADGNLVAESRATFSSQASPHPSLSEFKPDWNVPVFMVQFVPGSTNPTQTQHWFLMDNVNVQFVPIPATAFLLAFALAALAGFRRSPMAGAAS